MPVGQDQAQHIQLAQHLGKLFNTKFGATFVIPHSMIDGIKFIVTKKKSLLLLFLTSIKISYFTKCYIYF